MKVLFISSGNSINGISPIVKNQGESLKNIGVEIEYFPINGKGFKSYFKHITILRKYIETNTYDLYHVHYSLSSITASLAGCKPLVVSLMGSDTKSGFFWKKLIQFFAFFSWQAVIVKSVSMEEDIQIKKNQIIPNGVDLKVINPSSDNSVLAEKKTIIFAANPSRISKNYSLAEKAILLLKSPDIKFNVIYGKTHAEIIREINKATIVFLTSKWEGSPNIVKEAMACNRPIVATNVGDIAWLFGNEPGYFLTTFDPADIAEKIQLALEFAKKHGHTNGRKRILELGLDAPTVAKRILGVYESTLKQL